MHNALSPAPVTDEGIEAEIRAKGKTGVRLTPEDIQQTIAAEVIFTPPPEHEAAQQFPTLRLLTICVLVLRNGFTVVGKSACADPENFDKEIGEKLARADAVRQIWPLEGYLLRESIHGAESGE